MLAGTPHVVPRGPKRQHGATGTGTLRGRAVLRGILHELAQNEGNPLGIREDDQVEALRGHRHAPVDEAARMRPQGITHDLGKGQLSDNVIPVEAARACVVEGLFHISVYTPQLAEHGRGQRAGVVVGHEPCGRDGSLHLVDPCLNERAVIGPLRTDGVDAGAEVLREGVKGLPCQASLEKMRLLHQVRHGQGTCGLPAFGSLAHDVPADGTPERTTGEVRHEQPREGGCHENDRHEGQHGVTHACPTQDELHRQDGGNRHEEGGHVVGRIADEAHGRTE